MKFSQMRRDVSSQWGIAFGVATFIVLLLGAHSTIVLSYTSETSKWADQFLRTIAGWYLWAAFFPFILRLARDYRFSRGSKLESALVHILAGAGLATLHATLQILFNDWLLNPGRDWRLVKIILENSIVSSLLWRFFVYQALLAVCVAWDSYREAREAEIHASQIEADILQAQIESLKMQLDPEFLFKTLKQLSNVMKSDPDGAESMVAGLGDFLRMRLDHSGSPEITLREEIEFLKCYLAVGNSETQRPAEVLFDIDEKVLDCIVPGMILQVSMEDVVGGKSAEDAVRLKVTARKTDFVLVLTIQDAAAGSADSESPRLTQLLERLNALYASPVRNYTLPGSITRIEVPLLLERNKDIHAGQQHDFPNEAETKIDSNPVRKWLLITGVFTSLAVYFTIQKVLIFAGGGPAVNWSQHLLDCSGWYIWVLITPLVLRLSAGYPLQKLDGWKHVMIHFSAFVLCFISATVALAAVQWAGNLGDYSFLQRLPVSLARSPFSLDVICYSTIVAIESGLRFRRRYEFGKITTLRLSAQLARARLQALKMQLHPHFLFNALNSLSELMQEDVIAADEMIRNLEKFLKLTVNQNTAQEIPFEEELEYLKCYLAIESVRYQDRLSVKLEIDPGAMKVLIPNLLMQPIVENAIRHGIAPRTTQGQIEIRAKRSNGVLMVSVRDNGPGMSKTKKTVPVRSGVGLSNTRERLMQLYGSAHRFELIDAPEGGLIVTLEIPHERRMSRL